MASIFIEFAQNAGAASIVIAAFRLTLATLALAPLALTRYRAQLRQLTRREWLLALLSGVFLALHFSVWVTSLQYTSVASSVVLVTTTPLWVALFSPLVLHERVGRATYIGLVLALLGGSVVGLSDACAWRAGAIVCSSVGGILGGSVFLVDFLALAGAWMAAGYLLVGRSLRARMDLVPYIFVVYGMSAILLIAFMFGLRESPLGLSPITYLWLFLLALVPAIALRFPIKKWAALAALGYVYYAQRKVPESVETLKKALELDPKNPNALNSLGFIYAEEKIDMPHAAPWVFLGGRRVKRKSRLRRRLRWPDAENRIAPRGPREDRKKEPKKDCSSPSTSCGACSSQSEPLGQGFSIREYRPCPAARSPVPARRL